MTKVDCLTIDYGKLYLVVMKRSNFVFAGNLEKNAAKEAAPSFVNVMSLSLK